MSGQLELSGQIVIDGDSCSCAGAGDTMVKSLGSGCPKGYQTIVATAKALQVATTGVIGAAFVDLDILDTLTRVEFLYILASAEILLRVGAAPAVLLGAGGVFPTGFAGGETLDVTIDGTAVSVAFLVGDQTAAQCAARINAAAALEGLATPLAVVESSGQLSISGILTGASGTVAVTGGTGATILGFAGTPSAVGAGADLPIQGEFLCEFPRNANAPSRIQVSGVASLSIVAAGRSDSV